MGLKRASPSFRPTKAAFFFFALLFKAFDALSFNGFRPSVERESATRSRSSEFVRRIIYMAGGTRTYEMGTEIRRQRLIR